MVLDGLTITWWWEKRIDDYTKSRGILKGGGGTSNFVRR